MISHRVFVTLMCLNIKVMRTKLPILPKYGNLTVLSDSYRKSNKSSTYFVLAKCDCGTIKEFSINAMKFGSIKSCGCLMRKASSEANFKHGLLTHPLYYKWINIKNRCTNSNNPQYNHYGGRGITVCEEWKYDFIAFYKWSISNGYAEGLTIDRINNDGNYEPSNCRFVSHGINNQNRRCNKLSAEMVIQIRERLINGESGNDLAKEYGVTVGHIYKVKTKQTWK